MITTIAIVEIKDLFREKVFWLVSSLIMLLLLTALFTSSLSMEQLNTERAIAQRMSREGWLTQPPKNPHAAAHYGNFAFRIKSPLSFFDNGLDAYTGTYLFLEPHKQNGDKFSQAQESTSLLRFGELTPSLVLQNLFPLLIIFICFKSVTREKENNTIKLLFTQGSSMRQVVLGKILGNWTVFAGLLIPFFIIATISVAWFTEQKVELSRLILLFLSYLLYTAIWVSISILVSAWASTSHSALMRLLGFWMLAVIIIPKVSANIGNVIYKTPSQFQMAILINKDVEEGIDGHDPQDKRREALLEQTLKKYNVTKKEDLPVNFDAVAMIESEKYTTAVFRRRKAELDEIFKKQNRISEWAAFLNPSQAMQYSSMALCGTDFNHFRDFQEQAEEYRLYFVNVMNEYMSMHTKTGDWKTKFGKESYELIRPFVYQPASLTFALEHQTLSFCALIFWGIVCTILVSLTNAIRLL